MDTKHGCLPKGFVLQHCRVVPAINIERSAASASLTKLHFFGLGYCRNFQQSREDVGKIGKNEIGVRISFDMIDGAVDLLIDPGNIPWMDKSRELGDELEFFP